MGMLIMIIAGGATVWAETTSRFAHSAPKAHVILALAILVPAAVIWTLLRRHGERTRAAAAAPQRAAYSFGSPAPRTRRR